MTNCPYRGRTGHCLLDLLAALPALEGLIRLRTRVAGIAGTGLLKHEHIGTETRAATTFTLLLDTPAEDTAEADLVLDCTGTYSHPNTLGPSGIPAPANAPSPSASPHPPEHQRPRPLGGHRPACPCRKSAQPRPATSPPCTAPVSGGRCAVRRPTGPPSDDTLPSRQHLWTPPRPSPRTTTPGHLHTGIHLQPDPDGDDPRIPRHRGGPARDRLRPRRGTDRLHRRRLPLPAVAGPRVLATGAPMNLSATLLGSAGGDCLTQPSVGIEALRNPDRTSSSWAPRPTAASTPSCCAPATSRSTSFRFERHPSVKNPG